jgi:hypothetical protein
MTTTYLDKDTCESLENFKKNNKFVGDYAQVVKNLIEGSQKNFLIKHSFGFINIYK